MSEKKTLFEKILLEIEVFLKHVYTIVLDINLNNVFQ